MVLEEIPLKKTYTVLSDETEYAVEISPEGSGFVLSLSGTSHHFEVLTSTSTLYSLLVDGSKVLEADVAFHQDRCDLYIQNLPYQLEVFDPKRRMVSQSDGAMGGGLLLAPMPGKIVALQVKAGDTVEKGQALVVIEAMKMQNELNAPRSGVVQEVLVKAGDAVEADQKLVIIAEAAEKDS